MMTDAMADTVVVALPRDLAGALLTFQTHADDRWAVDLRAALQTTAILPKLAGTSAEPGTAERPSSGKYDAEFLGVPVTGWTLPEVFAKVVDLTAEVAPEALDKLAAMRARTRRYVALKPDMIHFGRRDLATMRTKSGWWISKNIGQEDLKRALRALAQAAGLVYGHDVHF